MYSFLCGKESETGMNEKEKNSQRIIYLDLLRIVSIFFMILLHVASSNWKKVPVASADWKAFTIYDGLALHAFAFRYL